MKHLRYIYTTLVFESDIIVILMENGEWSLPFNDTVVCFTEAAAMTGTWSDSSVGVAFGVLFDTLVEWL